jgi:hypothetical protein
MAPTPAPSDAYRSVFVLTGRLYTHPTNAQTTYTTGFLLSEVSPSNLFRLANCSELPVFPLARVI